MPNYDRLPPAVSGKRGADNPGAVRASVRRLRQQPGDGAASPAFIATTRGVGYRMPEPESCGGP